MTPPTDASLPATAALLAQVFGDDHLADIDYLTWLYEESPTGPVVETNLDDDAGRAAHYAVVPIDLRVQGVPIAAALSLNTAVHERARGGGIFTSLAEQTYESATARGTAGIVGVANANSTPGFLRRLSFLHAGALSATILPRTLRRTRNITSCLLEPNSADGGALIETISPLFALGRSDVAVEWNPTSLAWRLSSPRGPYALHRDDHGNAVISTATSVRGVRATAILAILPRSAPNRRAAGALAQAACRHHRAQLAVHVDVDGRNALPGFPLPARLKPSPLNLIWRPLSAAAPAAPPFTCFEFFDFDAY